MEPVGRNRRRNGGHDPYRRHTPFSTASDTASIKVWEVNQTPVAADGGTIYVMEDSLNNTFTIGSLVNPGPANESWQTVKLNGMSYSGSNADVRIEHDNGTVDYVPNPNFTGTDSFQVLVTDNGTTNGVAAPITTTLTITVNILRISFGGLSSPGITYGTAN